MKKIKTPKTEIGYKVVRVQDRRNYSCTSRHIPKRCIRYRVGIWENPFANCGPLAVFDRLSSAKDFLNRSIFVSEKKKTYKIYMCRYIPSKGSCLFIGNRSYWNCTPIDASSPPGTKLARSVKIIKKCYEKKTKNNKKRKN